MNIYELMTKVGYRYTKYTGEYGIEIETESKVAYDRPILKFWDVVRDGSLRNYGLEYVLKQPVLYEKELDAALEDFKASTSKIAFIQDTHTTSVHVHVNMLNRTFTQMANFVTAYFLVENLLIRFSGPDRLSNLFCLPVCDAEGVLTIARDLMTTIASGRFDRINTNPEAAKYAAINFASFTQRGTLEIRSFRGVTDTKIIKDWVSLIHSLALYSCREGMTPLKIIEDYKAMGPEIVSDIFGEFVNLVDYDDKAALLEKNLWYAASIAATTKDWTKFGQPPEVKKKTNTNDLLNQYALNNHGVEFRQLDAAQQLLVIENVQRAEFRANMNAAPVRRAAGRGRNMPAAPVVGGWIEDNQEEDD